MKELRGATAIVTGASRGIGPYIARALAREGARVVLVARSEDLLHEVAEKLERGGGEVLAVPADIATPEGRERTVERAIDHFGRVDILVNNAAMGMGGALDRVPGERLAAMVDINLLAPILLTQQVLPGMLARRRGHIVNVASLAGKFPIPFNATYSASKAGLIAFTRSLQAELRGTGVGASCVSPGFVSRAGMYAASSKRGTALASRLGRTSPPQGVANAVVRAIERNQVDVHVNPVPLRPLSVLAEAAPGALQWLLAATRMTKSMSPISRRDDAK